MLLEKNNLRDGLIVQAHIFQQKWRQRHKIARYLLCLAWNFKQILKIKDLIKKGIKFYFPIKIND